MNKKVLIKIGTIALILLTIILITSVDATSVLNQIKPETRTTIGKTTQSVANTVIGYITVIAIGISIVMLIALAIKYMTASPDARAEYKQTLIKYGIGVLIIFTASTLANVIADVVSNLTSRV